MPNPNAHPDGELVHLVDQQREDTIHWQDKNNLSPQGISDPFNEMNIRPEIEDNRSVPEVHASVTVSSADKEAGGRVRLTVNGKKAVGRVLASNHEKFWVAWKDGEETIEDKANYELVVKRSKKKAKQKKHSEFEDSGMGLGPPNCPTCGRGPGPAESPGAAEKPLVEEAPHSEGRIMLLCRGCGEDVAGTKTYGISTTNTQEIQWLKEDHALRCKGRGR